MIIYAINLTINKTIYSAFQKWLTQHVKKMLQFPGFLQAHILKPQRKDSETEKLIVQYQIENQAALDNYLEKYAPAMRAEGLALFKNDFVAEREIFEVQADMQ